MRSSARQSTHPGGTGLGAPNAGDIQISGPGTLEVLAGQDLNLGVGPNNADGTGSGISSIGNIRDPYLSTFTGANVIAAAGLGSAAGFTGPGTQLDFVSFENEYLAPGSDESAIYLPDLGSLMGLPAGASDAAVWQAFNALPAENRDVYALNIFYMVLRDAGRNHNAGTGSGYNSGYAAISALFPQSPWPYSGSISLTSREVKTTNGGDISLLAPGGQVTVGFDIAGNQPLDQGILTEDGGNISIFAQGNVNVGTSRIFTLHGGNEIIWSTSGNIAAGNSSKTVQSAPPTRVLVDPQSASVQTDLAGLATGGGIGVLGNGRWCSSLRRGFDRAQRPWSMRVMREFAFPATLTSQPRRSLTQETFRSAESPPVCLAPPAQTSPACPPPPAQRVRPATPRRKWARTSAISLRINSRIFRQLLMSK